MPCVKASFVQLLWSRRRVIESPLLGELLEVSSVMKFRAMPTLSLVVAHQQCQQFFGALFSKPAVDRATCCEGLKQFEDYAPSSLSTDLRTSTNRSYICSFLGGQTDFSKGCEHSVPFQRHGVILHGLIGQLLLRVRMRMPDIIQYRGSLQKIFRQGVVGHANTAWGRLYETYSMRYHGFSSGNELDTPDLIVGPVTRASLAILTTD